MHITGRANLAGKGGSLAIVDVSNPADPLLVGARNSAGSSSQISPHDLAVKGGHVVVVDTARDLAYRYRYLYVTPQNDNRLGILKVLDPNIFDPACSVEVKKWIPSYPAGNAWLR